MECAVFSATFNNAFSFPYTLQGRQCEMVFTSVSGHLMETEFSAPFRKWHSCRPIELYNAPISKEVPEVKSRSILDSLGCVLVASSA